MQYGGTKKVQIGQKVDLGTGVCSIYALIGDERNPNQIQSGWKYMDKNCKWQAAGSNEVIIQDCSAVIDARDQSYCTLS